MMCCHVHIDITLGLNIARHISMLSLTQQINYKHMKYLDAGDQGLIFIQVIIANKKKVGIASLKVVFRS